VRDIQTGPNRSTTETRDSICKLLCDELETGLSIRVACDVVGLSMDGYYRWKKRAEQGDDEAIQLMRRLKAARAKGLKHHVGLIQRAADLGDWRAQAWLVDKLYPNQRIEEIEYSLAEGEDGKPNEWSTPERLLPIVQHAVRSGLVTFEQLLAIAPKQAERPSNTPWPPAAARLDTIRDAIVNQLADGPRETTELREVVCALTSCTHAEFDAACEGLDLAQDFSSGSKPMVRLAHPEDLPRTTPAVERQEAEPTSGAESTTAAETSGSQRGSWFDGDGHGVGDFIREKRGR
jgi:hypothetical protein